MVACLERNDGNAEFHQILDFLSSSTIHYALTVSPTIYAYYIEQFWTTAKSQIVNNVKQIHAIVDGKAVVISESLVRNDLLFDNEDGITCLTNDDIFENLTLMGQSKGFSRTVTPLFDSMLVQNQAPEGEGEDDRVVRAATTASRLEAEQESGNITKTQPTTTLNEPSPQGTGSGSGPWSQDTMGGMQGQTRSEGVPNLSSDPPLSGSHTLG
ncbi:hypothetical protein Tco_1187584, partial [Tanacetum coccineum]